jgi:CheY-like chemotaxis protein
LSQVLGFAKQSGGGVSIRSTPGEGTSICIYLPRSNAVPEQPRAGDQRSDVHALTDARILLVDDDPAVREVTAEALRELGYQVAEVGSGGAALDLIERMPVDLMIVDFAMPGMNGAELATRVRKRRADMPILFVTGFADRTLLAGISEAHIVGKPFAPGDLADKARLALTRCH